LAISRKAAETLSEWLAQGFLGLSPLTCGILPRLLRLSTTPQRRLQETIL
jgi:hypothetical protein